MRVVIIGQRSFGKAVLEAFQSRGDEVVGVFIAPEKRNSRPDALKVHVLENNIRLFQFENLASDEALSALKDLNADIAVMAYVVQFVPREFAQMPKFGTIQFHPSLLPKYRGPSAISWAIVCGEHETGVTIFRPTDVMDEGPVILQKTVPIHPDETAGALYYHHLFPLGVQALLEAADLIVSGNYEEKPQDVHKGSYESWLKEPEARINWNNHVDQVYDLIRGCNPNPGAWTTFRGEKLVMMECRKIPHNSFKNVRGKAGTITSLDGDSFIVGAQGGEIRVLSVRTGKEKNISAREYQKRVGLDIGMKFGD
ncbi:methionyl-tRNA formyltransferase [Oxalobacter paraformigenes]|uniref:methionyl-tRNA formyltransferase n=1 Tax=Oxalobacter paraformigenes TaxID=556268 RepID=C3X5Q2_9BURK|nr:methionyl-tRNA formyltransferase [Oxalobacter paraformigenes]EEO28538.1 hypothetical protein OFAG_01691 [Oxalobacter paraformigenes]